MTVRMSISNDGEIKIAMGSYKVRLDSLDKFLARNRDAILVQLVGPRDLSMQYKPGHVCNIEEDESGEYYVFVGKHMIGRLPAEALEYAEQVESSPEFLVSMVGKVEDDSISIYIAE